MADTMTIAMLSRPTCTIVVTKGHNATIAFLSARVGTCFPGDGFTIKSYGLLSFNTTSVKTDIVCVYAITMKKRLMK